MKKPKHKTKARKWKGKMILNTETGDLLRLPANVLAIFHIKGIYKHNHKVIDVIIQELK